MTDTVSLGRWDTRPWRNWTGDISVRPERHFYPTTLREVVGIVRCAEGATPPRRVHAAGSGWSFCAPSATSGYLVETYGLNRTLSTVLPTCLVNPQGFWADDGAGSWRGLYHVEAGVQVYELCQRLDRGEPSLHILSRGPGPQPERWALKTMGGSSGQTLAGAVSTGTHGADAALAPLADAVRAIHLVGPGGRQHWIERAEAVTIPDALREAYPHLDVHHDDTLLRSALVSLGRFGIVYSMLLDVVPQFDLHSVTRPADWRDVRRQLAEETLLDAHRGVQIVIAPYPDRPGLHRTSATHGPDGNTPPRRRTCYVTTRDERAPQDRPRARRGARLTSAVVNAGGSLLRVNAAYLLGTWLLARRAGRVRGIGPALARALTAAQLPAMLLLPFSDGRPGDLVASVCRTANRAGLWWVTARLVNGVFEVAQRSSTRDAVGYQIMAGPPWADEYYRGHGLEVFFDATSPSYLDVIDHHLLPVILRHAQDGTAIAGWFSLRHTGRSGALLAMQRWERTACVEVAVLRGVPGSVQVLRDLEAVAVRQGGLVHWGQENNIGETVALEAFPGLPTWREQLRRIAGEGPGSLTFENEYCHRRGLTLPDH